MVVKKFGSQVVHLSVHAPANGYVIVLCAACEQDMRTFGSCRLHSHRNLVLVRASKLLGCYMVKPHGQLVLVSSTPHSAYTPNLSTS